MELLSARVLWDMVDGPMPRGLLGVGSGDLHHDENGWTLFLGGYSTSFRNRLYTASAPEGSDPVTAEWTLQSDARGRAAPLIADPPRSAWDGGGLHTPSYLAATADAPARIYYAGRAGRRHVGAGSGYSIGVLENHDGAWVRRDSPLLTGSDDRASVLEPRVVRHGDTYVMWFLSTPYEVAPGQLPNYEIRTSTSRDGVTEWSTPQLFTSTAEGFFDVALVEHNTGWSMVVARGTNLHGTTPYPAQGLWIMSAAALSGERADWSTPVQLLDTDDPNSPKWMGRGVCDPAAVRTDSGDLIVFVTGTRRYRSYLSLTKGQLRHGRRPPVPAPFYLSTAVLRFSGEAPHSPEPGA